MYHFESHTLVFHKLDKKCAIYKIMLYQSEPIYHESAFSLLIYQWVHKLVDGAALIFHGKHILSQVSSSHTGQVSSTTISCHRDILLSVIVLQCVD